MTRSKDPADVHGWARQENARSFLIVKRCLNLKGHVHILKACVRYARTAAEVSEESVTRQAAHSQSAPGQRSQIQENVGVQ